MTKTFAGHATQSKDEDWLRKVISACLEKMLLAPTFYKHILPSYKYYPKLLPRNISSHKKVILYERMFAL